LVAIWNSAYLDVEAAEWSIFTYDVGTSYYDLRPHPVTVAFLKARSYWLYGF